MLIWSTRQKGCGSDRLKKQTGFLEYQARSRTTGSAARDCCWRRCSPCPTGEGKVPDPPPPPWRTQWSRPSCDDSAPRNLSSPTDRPEKSRAAKQNRNFTSRVATKQSKEKQECLFLRDTLRVAPVKASQAVLFEISWQISGWSHGRSVVVVFFNLFFCHHADPDYCWCNW